MTYALGGPLDEFGDGTAKVLTFVVTQDCNMACKYCYVTHKNQENRMDLSTAQQAVDYFLAHSGEQKAVVWDFIGGEPLLETELIDQICDYIKLRTHALNHKWQSNYMFSISTNGLLYTSRPVQRLIAKNRDRLSISISIDGTESKHDMNRVYPNGKGTYRDVMRNVAVWLEQFPNQARPKVTFASEDLPLLKESIIHLWDLGLKMVPANVVFEDVWHDGDDQILERQLKTLADYALDTGLWASHNCTFFSDGLGFPYDEGLLHRNWCGTGAMAAVDANGSIFPCFHFVDHCLEHRPGYALGNIRDGVDDNRLRPFLALCAESISDPECLKCEVATGCAWCPGSNYDSAEAPTLFKRATYICKMHKARVRANEYYWAKLRRRHGHMRSPGMLAKRRKYLYLIASGTSPAHCTYRTNPSFAEERMDGDLLRKGLEFAADNLYRPVILHPPSGPVDVPEWVDPIHIISPGTPRPEGDVITVYDNLVDGETPSGTTILIVDRADLKNLEGMALSLLSSASRVNLMVRDAGDYDEGELHLYEETLRHLAEALLPRLAQGEDIGLNVLTDRLLLREPDDCGAGAQSLALAPDGRFYLCPAFYHEGIDWSAGSLSDGLSAPYLAPCDRSKAPICAACQALHCKRCLLDNWRRTLQINIPARMQCLTSHAELRVSSWLRSQLAERGTVLPGAEITSTSSDPLDDNPAVRERRLVARGSTE